MKSPAFLPVAAAALVASFSALTAQAQTPAPLPAPSADAAKAAGMPKAEESQQAPRFDILEFAVTGNTVLPPEDVERAVYPFMGPGKSFADAENARRALEQAYQRAGYLSVTVLLPGQEVTADGVVRLEVTEATVDKLRISGAKYHLPSEIKAGMPSVQPGSIPNFNQVQKELGALAEKSPSREITPLIGASAQPGRIDVDLQVQDKLPLRGQIELNSSQSYGTHRGRLEAAVSYDNLFQSGHTLSANLAYSPFHPGETKVIVLGYGLQLAPRQNLLFLLGNNDSRTPTDVGGATLSRGTIFQARYLKSLAARGSYSHNLQLGVDYASVRDANEDIFGFSSKSAGLRYPKFVAGYQLNDEGEPAGRRSSFSADLAFGTAGLGGRDVDCNGSPRDQFACKRSGATPDFQVLRLSASHREPLFKRWALSAEGTVQFASGPLSPLEQIGVGGVDSVRGYYDYEQTGDQGWKLRFELSSPEFLAVGNRGLWALAFFDRAQVRIFQPLPQLVASGGGVLRSEEISRVDLGSWGLGLRLNNGAGLEASLDYALPIFDTSKRDSAGQFYVPASGSKAGKPGRWDASVKYSF